MILTTIFKVTKLLASFLLNIHCNIIGISKWNLMTLTPFQGVTIGLKNIYCDVASKEDNIEINCSVVPLSSPRPPPPHTHTHISERVRERAEKESLTVNYYGSLVYIPLRASRDESTLMPELYTLYTRLN